MFDEIEDKEGGDVVFRSRDFVVAELSVWDVGYYATVREIGEMRFLAEWIPPFGFICVLIFYVHDTNYYRVKV